MNFLVGFHQPPTVILIPTVLKQAQGITNWTFGKTGKKKSLDLDLHEKVYLLVHSCKDLHNRYVIRLGELHIFFAMVGAIWAYIEGSGIDQSWVMSRWFSGNTMHQVQMFVNEKGPFCPWEQFIFYTCMFYLQNPMNHQVVMKMWSQLSKPWVVLILKILKLP